jgi:hypothetical protein
MALPRPRRRARRAPLACAAIASVPFAVAMIAHLRTAASCTAPRPPRLRHRQPPGVRGARLAAPGPRIAACRDRDTRIRS